MQCLGAFESYAFNAEFLPFCASPVRSKAQLSCPMGVPERADGLPRSILGQRQHGAADEGARLQVSESTASGHCQRVAKVPPGCVRVVDGDESVAEALRRLALAEQLSHFSADLQGVCEAVDGLSTPPHRRSQAPQGDKAAGFSRSVLFGAAELDASLQRRAGALKVSHLRVDSA
eukprot:scaffold1320_cov253-Pinguiococcus_pyrenoidosus.AAC.16